MKDGQFREAESEEGCWRVLEVVGGLLEGIAPPGVCVFLFLKAKPIEDYEGHAGSHRRPGASD